MQIVQPMKRRIASHYALISGELKRNIIVEVDDTGLITSIERAENLDSEARVEFYPGILIPGMVNAHSHLELAYLKGAIEEGSGFAGFARAIGAVRGNYSNSERVEAARKADALMWCEGVQAVADIANDELIMPIKEQSPIEYHTMFEFFGLNNTSTKELQELCQRYNNCSITPHSIYSVQDAPFKQICSMGDATISLHFLESEAETELFHQRGSLHEWYNRMGWSCDFIHYDTPARRIVESIDASRQLMVVHACMATESDVATLVSHFTKPVTWVLCPESNRYISGLKPPIEMLRRAGARLAIGTDSLASARHLSMIDNMRLIEGAPLAELLTAATLHGAMALGIEDRIGSLEVGKRPGLVVIERADLHTLQLSPESRSRRII